MHPIISASGDVSTANNTTYDTVPITIVDSSMIFSDGFESGNTSAWSGTVP